MIEISKIKLYTEWKHKYLKLKIFTLFETDLCRLLVKLYFWHKISKNLILIKIIEQFYFTIDHWKILFFDIDYRTILLDNVEIIAFRKNNKNSKTRYINKYSLQLNFNHLNNK